MKWNNVGELLFWYAVRITSRPLPNACHHVLIHPDHWNGLAFGRRARRSQSGVSDSMRFWTSMVSSPQLCLPRQNWPRVDGALGASSTTSSFPSTIL
jgi:hypothetical protein